MKYQFNVMYLDFNTNKPVWFDVMPIIRDEYKNARNRPVKEGGYEPYWKPKTMDELKEFIDFHMKYHYWCKAEWECMVKPLFGNGEEKMDLYEMFIKNNIDAIASLIAEELKIKE